MSLIFLHSFAWVSFKLNHCLLWFTCSSSSWFFAVPMLFLCWWQISFENNLWHFGSILYKALSVLGDFLFSFHSLVFIFASLSCLYWLLSLYAPVLIPKCLVSQASALSSSSECHWLGILFQRVHVYFKVHSIIGSFLFLFLFLYWHDSFHVSFHGSIPKNLV